ncbi:Glu/Leu/Phe/Val dehydrogenase [Aquicella lusitana]|uniref:Leucine dehydrogenase n=1 Tax=Aquicella lusitana TaxID=254246 RepID=A0A370G418_9COXI|nr:Glu/Leu/Phe/Val dehydrogenase [Aquicella lusitana]RDI37589.1 leucine dehydrogenase [Aquicella lusitana]VVC73900.1 Leucine dehydrogenase [Aquicella lusitana]
MHAREYNVETYLIDSDLSFTIAYEKDSAGLPANGGLRFYQYADVKNQEAEAIVLATHMTEKHRIYNTGFSGVKIVANGQNNPENKRKLLTYVGNVLNKHKGSIYTGCDLNINNEDMEFLCTVSPYVLNAMGSNINTSEATGYGVYGSLMAVLARAESDKSRPLEFIIHGAGKIGSVLANKLISSGHKVYTYDVNPAHADIPGAINISANENWYEMKCDYLLLCSASNIITPANAEKINCKWIVSSANHPFSSPNVISVLEEKNIFWIPDVVSNAGAVICDSIEFKQPEKYRSIEPDRIYNFVYKVIYHKTNNLLTLADNYKISPQEALDVFLSMAKNADIAQLIK